VPFGDTARPSASLMFVPLHEGATTVGIITIQSYTPQADTGRSGTRATATAARDRNGAGRDGHVRS
jgi:hypothetical protein